jgi:hypothetical protein
MSATPQVIVVRGERRFVCEYTGQPISTRYFLPNVTKEGKVGKGKTHCAATLPILARILLDKQKGEMNETFTKQMATLSEFYEQPYIPVAPEINSVDYDSFEDYVADVDQGTAWLRIAKGQPIAEYKSKAKKKSAASTTLNPRTIGKKDAKRRVYVPPPGLYAITPKGAIKNIGERKFATLLQSFDGVRAHWPAEHVTLLSTAKPVSQAGPNTLTAAWQVDADGDVIMTVAKKTELPYPDSKPGSSDEEEEEEDDE